MADVYEVLATGLADYFGRIKSLHFHVHKFKNGHGVEPKLVAFAKQGIDDLLFRDNPDAANTKKWLAKICQASNPKPQIISAIAVDKLPSLGFTCLGWIDALHGFGRHEAVLDLLRTVAISQPGYGALVKSMSRPELLAAPVAALFTADTRVKVAAAFDRANVVYGPLGLPWGPILSEKKTLQEALYEVFG